MRRIPIGIALAAAAVCAAAAVLPIGSRAQGNDFSKIDKFESLSSGTPSRRFTSKNYHR